MCVAYPGKILSIENHHAHVDFTGSVVPVNISMVDVAPGDYVLVHAGMAIQKVETEEAQEWIALFRDLEDATKEMDEESGFVAATVTEKMKVNNESVVAVPKAPHKLESAASYGPETEDTHHA